MTDNVQNRAQAEEDTFDYILSLLVAETRDVFVVDENTTTLGLAAMRGSFRGIWASSTSDQVWNANWLTRRLQENAGAAEMRKSRYSFELLAAGMEDQAKDVTTWKAQLLNEIRAFNQTQIDELKYQFSADEIGNHPLPGDSRKLIWFNFPWHSRAGYVYKYIRQFLEGCAKQQEDGGIVLVTITRNKRWNPFYGLTGFLELAEKLGYRWSCEHCFMYHIFESFGFRHITWNEKNNIHYWVVPRGDTYVLIKDKKEEANG